MIINKKIVTGNFNILKYMFPSYDIISDIPEFPEVPCIYIGDMSKIDKLVEVYNEKGLDFIIYTRSPSDINLNDRMTLAQIVFEKYNRLVPKYLANIINELDEITFMNNIKYFWITGKWKNKTIEKENTFLNFIEDINKSSLELYRTYFKVIESINPYVLESSFMTFLLRIKENDFKGLSPKYRSKLKTYSNKIDAMLDGIEVSLDYNINNYELKLLNLFINIINYKKM